MAQLSIVDRVVTFFATKNVAPPNITTMTMESQLRTQPRPFSLPADVSAAPVPSAVPSGPQPQRGSALPATAVNEAAASWMLAVSKPQPVAEVRAPAPPTVNPLESLAQGQPLTESIDFWDFASLDPKRYKDLFARGETPDPSVLANQTVEGMILHVPWYAGGSRLLPFLAGNYLRALGGGFVGQEHAFENRFGEVRPDGTVRGVNFLPSKGEENLPMILSSAESKLHPGGRALTIDYNLPDNAAYERPTMDEMRRIPGTDWFFGRMSYRVFGMHVPLLWFVVRPRSAATP